MKHDMADQNRLAKFLESKGDTAIRRYESKIAELKPNDPLRADARDLWAAFGESMTLAFLMERHHAHEMDAQRADMKITMHEASVDKMHKTWAAYKVSKVPGAVAFANYHLGGVYGVGDGGGSTGRVGDSLIYAISKENAKAGIHPNPNIVIVSVKTALADKFAKRHKIDTKTTLSWESDGFTSFAFSAGSTGYSGARGVDTVVSAHLGETVHAPYTKPSWKVTPSNALPKGTDKLPEPPQELADILGAIGGAVNGKLLDRLLL
jgi:hypothetical protein